MTAHGDGLDEEESEKSSFAKLTEKHKILNSSLEKFGLRSFDLRAYQA